MNLRPSIHKTCNKVVIKVGTNLLADKTSGINAARIDRLAADVASLRAAGRQVAIVTSGAIGAGVAALKFKARPKTLPHKQAAAAVGQPLLMEAYEKSFRKYGCPIAQILLTKEDFTNRKRYVNAKNTFFALFEQGVVPIINENDTVAVDEIKLGDNDNLSAFVAHLVEADLLVLLSDIDGLYSDDPSKNKNATLIPVVQRVSPQIEKLARSSNTELSTGGMITKIQAAKRCVSSGIAMIIANGKDPDVLEKIFSGALVGTLFLPSSQKLTVRKKWIGFVSHSKGSIIVDDGARIALVKKKKSLLASGILEVRGDFKKNDTVVIMGVDAVDIGKGVTRFSSIELQRIRGKKSGEAAKILGRKNCDEVIHRDDLVVIE